MLVLKLKGEAVKVWSEWAQCIKAIGHVTLKELKPFDMRNKRTLIRSLPKTNLRSGLMDAGIKCKSCISYQVLNPNHIVKGESVRNCVWGEMPNLCYRKKEKEMRK